MQASGFFEAMPYLKWVINYGGYGFCWVLIFNKALVLIKISHHHHIIFGRRHPAPCTSAEAECSFLREKRKASMPKSARCHNFTPFLSPLHFTNKQTNDQTDPTPEPHSAKLSTHTGTRQDIKKNIRQLNHA